MKSQDKLVASSEKQVVRKNKVFVGLSGGVDSSVSAALLKKEGFDVTGVFIKAWTPEGYPCTWKEDRRSAMRAAAVLDIPFLTLDLEKEYKKEIVDYMIREYRDGNTPNPDVLCNKEIKFGHFLDFALKSGADFVATGHYCEKLEIKNSKLEKIKLREGEGGEVSLFEASDKNKDQSYFLWTLTQDQLRHILFPIGHLQKQEVRKLAEKFGLPQATRRDSQGLCFLGQVDMKEFLSRYIKPKKGNVLNQKGEVVGEHDGAFFFTIGERHGFTITKKSPEDSPLYVVSKDIKKNTITVSEKIVGESGKKFSDKSLASPTSVGEETRGLLEETFFQIGLKNINWIEDKEPELDKEYLARIRYRQEKISCKIKIEEGRVFVVFGEKPWGLSSGQSLVLYEKEKMLGGGVIAE